MQNEALQGAQQRLAKAETDLRSPRVLRCDPDRPIDSVGFDTQQAAAPLFAALLRATQQAQLPTSHDLHHLGDLLPKRVTSDIPVETWVEFSYQDVSSQYSNGPGNPSTQVGEYLRIKRPAVEPEVRGRRSEIEAQ